MIDLEEFLTNLNLPTEPPEYLPCQSMDGFPEDRPTNRQARLRQRGISLDGFGVGIPIQSLFTSTEGGEEDVITPKTG